MNLEQLLLNVVSSKQINFFQFQESVKSLWRYEFFDCFPAVQWISFIFDRSHKLLFLSKVYRNAYFGTNLLLNIGHFTSCHRNADAVLVYILV